MEENELVEPADPILSPHTQEKDNTTEDEDIDNDDEFEDEFEEETDHDFPGLRRASRLVSTASEHSVLTAIENLINNENLDDEQIPESETYNEYDASPALSQLQSAKETGKITEEKCDKLRRRLDFMVCALQQSRSGSRELSEQLKNAHSTLRGLLSCQREFEKKPMRPASVTKPHATPTQPSSSTLESMTSGISVDASELRAKVLTLRVEMLHKNELSIYSELTKKRLEYERDVLREQRQRQVRCADYEKTASSLDSAISQLRKELGRRKEALETTKEQLKAARDDNVNHDNGIANVQKELDSLGRHLLDLMDPNATARRGSSQQQEIHSRLQSRLAQLNDKHKLLSNDFKFNSDRLTKLQEEETVQQVSIRNANSLMLSLRHRLDLLSNSLFALREEGTILKKDAADANEVMRYLESERRTAQELVTSSTRNVERTTHNLRTVEVRLNVQIEKKLNVERALKAAKEVVRSLPTDDQRSKVMFNKIKTEALSLQKSFIKQQTEAGIAAGEVEKRLKEIRILDDSLHVEKRNALKMTKKAELAAVERRQRRESLLRLHRERFMVNEELRFVKAENEGLNRIVARSWKILVVIQAMTEALFLEKSNLYRQQLLIHQSAAEWRDKLRIVGSETDNLVALRDQRDRQLQKLRARLSASLAARDVIRHEMLDARHRHNVLEERKDAAVAEEHKQRQLLAAAQKRGYRTNRRFENVSKSWAERHTHVLDILQEVIAETVQFKTLTDIVTKIRVGLHGIDIQKHRITIASDNLRRDVTILRQKYTIADSVFPSRLSILQLQMQDVLRDREHLEVALAFPKTRPYRELTARPDLDDPEKLENKRKCLTDRLYAVHEQCRNREKALDEANARLKELAGDVFDVAGEGENRRRALQLTEEMLIARQKLEDLTRQQKRLIAEVAFRKAEADILSKRKQEIQNEVDNAKKRLESGDAPTPDARRRWAMEKKLQEVEKNKLQDTNTQYHWLQPVRPTAYIPDCRGRHILPLPRPYGALAPFKPAKPSPLLRFVKTPFKKEINL